MEGSDIKSIHFIVQPSFKLSTINRRAEETTSTLGSRHQEIGRVQNINRID